MKTHQNVSIAGDPSRLLRGSTAPILLTRITLEWPLRKAREVKRQSKGPHEENEELCEGRQNRSFDSGDTIDRYSHSTRLLRQTVTCGNPSRSKDLVAYNCRSIRAEEFLTVLYR